MSPASPLKSGLLLALINTLILLGFIGAMFGMKAYNNHLLATGQPMLMFVPMVVAFFALFAPGSWFFAGRRLRSTGKSRFISALIGSIPIGGCAVLALGLLVFNVVTGRGDAAAVAVPLLMAIVAALGAAIFVAMILVTVRGEAAVVATESGSATADLA